MQKQTVQFLAGLVLVAGFLVMIVSFLALGAPRPEYVTAGMVGFLAGAVLIGASLIAAAILAAGDNSNVQVRIPNDDDALERFRPSRD